MKVTTLYNEEKKGKVRIAQSDNCELANPKDYYFGIAFNIFMLSYVENLLKIQKIAGVSKELNEVEEEKVFEVLKTQAIKGATKENEDIYSQNLPENCF